MQNHFNKSMDDVLSHWQRCNKTIHLSLFWIQRNNRWVSEEVKAQTLLQHVSELY